MLEGRIVPSLTVPAYNSLPGAKASVYLNFTGDFVSSWLGFQNISIPAFGAGSGLTTATLLNDIKQIWQNAAEDYSPFNVNVTTVRANFWRSIADRRWRQRIVAACRAGGLWGGRRIKRQQPDPSGRGVRVPIEPRRLQQHGRHWLGRLARVRPQFRAVRAGANGRGSGLAGTSTPALATAPVQSMEIRILTPAASGGTASLTSARRSTRTTITTIASNTNVGLRCA